MWKRSKRMIVMQRKMRSWIRKLEEEEEETQERKTSGRTQVLNSGKYGTIHDPKTGQDFWLVLTYTCVVLLFH